MSREGGEAEYEALWRGLAVSELGRDVTRVHGPDAERYLQGQLSQDIAKLAPGGWAWALLLQPQGRLVALLRCSRLADDEFLLDTDSEMSDAVVGRLLRFRLRTKAEIEALPWRALAVRGRADLLGAQAQGVVGDSMGNVTVPFSWGGLTGYDVVGPSPAAPGGAIEAAQELYEAARIVAGFPKHGLELDERTIPAEAGLVAAAVSFTKGCYTGQELVARIDSRGSNVPRHLRGFLLSGPCRASDALLASASPDDAREVGRLTSVALSPSLGWVALGYAARAVQVGDVLTVQSSSPQAGPVTAQVHHLPLREQ
ncbi:MAG TPA: hypothetical protein VME20_06465 [Acidimicrobiales bacterium]|nr:hypothetical protein [Acidimicrobiales bacterium]